MFYGGLKMVGGIDGVGSVDEGSRVFGNAHAAQVQENTMQILGAMSDSVGISSDNPDELLGQLADKLGMDKETLGMIVATAADPTDPNSKLAKDVLGLLLKLKGYSNPFSPGQ